MLDEKDFQAIEKIMDEKIAGSEERMTAKIAESEERMTTKIAESAEESRRYMDVIIESSIKPTLELLAEGQAAIRELLVPRSRVDDLESDVKFLKLMYRQMSDDISRLKKAQ